MGLYLWWRLCPLHLHACQVRATVGDSGLCCKCLCDVIRALINSLVQFSSVQDGINALGKAHKLCAPTLPLKRSQCSFDDVPLSSFRGRSSSASSFHASLLQAINSAISLALCPQVVSQASQHFRSSKHTLVCLLNK